MAITRSSGQLTAHGNPRSGGKRLLLSGVVRQEQTPLIPAYAFTDYRAQGQTLPYVIVDIARPPGGRD
jgi:ATP-dependent exoDNAse (exonuclease V) alpha subunit